MPYQEISLASLQARLDQQQDQIAKLAQANADLLVYVNDHIKELKAQSDTTTLENGLEILRGEHATWLARLENDLAELNAKSRGHNSRLTRLEALQWPLDDVSTVEVTAELEAIEAPPEVTISHDMLANGTWRYKTSVTMALGDTAEVASALENADQLARVEANRRAALDRDEAPLSRGLGKPKPEAIKTQLE